LGVVWDGQITFWEAMLMTLVYIVYLLYTITHKEGDIEEYQNPILQWQKENIKVSVRRTNGKKNVKIISCGGEDSSIVKAKNMTAKSHTRTTTQPCQRAGVQPQPKSLRLNQ